ncbi:AAA family ATPase [Desulfofustis glycolicus]|uniref:Cytidylate kinase n=1 Tax=Desulfofustis glycolicus DSM 9705 TaxID=1121409 RepID=A0A1M5TKB7_9BACT|nr:cytidylate kinase-like family protein [Desulfofustis glycolicus]SHH51126.1 Cytidylate kinase [Desulfofustis glycolicus DSM 9705]
MSIICISRGSYYRGREVAQKVADTLGYGCISRDSLLASSEEFDIPEIKLMRNIQHATQILERYSFGRERYVNYISSAILRHLKQDNYVYHGIAGQFFFYDVRHLLKVRIIADLEERVDAEATRQNIPADQVRLQLKHDDEERQKWALFLYGIDIIDPSIYDMVINVSAMSVDDATQLICQAVQLPCYQATEKSLAKVRDLSLAAEVRAALFDFPQAGVTVIGGTVYINVKAPEEQEAAIRARIEQNIAGIDDIDQREIRVDPYY